MSPVRHNVDPGGVVAGQSDGHGGHGVLHYGEQLDVAEMEVVLVTKPEGWNSFQLLFIVRIINLFIMNKRLTAV